MRPEVAVDSFQVLATPQMQGLLDTQLDLHRVEEVFASPLSRGLRD
jgi:hypothetical protein